MPASPERQFELEAERLQHDSFKQTLTSNLLRPRWEAPSAYGESRIRPPGTATGIHGVLPMFGSTRHAAVTHAVHHGSPPYVLVPNPR